MPQKKVLDQVKFIDKKLHTLKGHQSSSKIIFFGKRLRYIVLLAYNEKLQEELRNGVIRNALLENKRVVDLTILEIDNTM